MKILGIETSCDDTAVSVVEDGRVLISNVIASQVSIHARYGGVVPEVASRQHMLEIIPAVNESFKQGNVSWTDIDAVAVTNGPGLAGALIVGVNTAKALAFGNNIPFIGINHLEGHIYANWLENELPDEFPGFPLLCLIASGGHTDLILMNNHGKYELLGRTRDDAAGEAFDKAARVLGLGFPGGPEIQRVSENATGKITLPRAWLRGSLDFSFSGLKTALLNKAKESGIYPPNQSVVPDSDQIREMASAFQVSVADVITTKTIMAANQRDAKGILLGGGVAANTLLRTVLMDRSKLPVLIPSPKLCTDNGAMIASCAYFKIQQGYKSDWALDIYPNIQLG